MPYFYVRKSMDVGRTAIKYHLKLINTKLDATPLKTLSLFKFIYLQEKMNVA